MAGSSASAELRPQGETVTLSETPAAELPLVVRVRVAAESSASPPSTLPQTRVLTVNNWRSVGTALHSEISAGGGLLISLRWQPTTDGSYDLQAEARADTAVWIGQLSLDIELPDGDATMGNRELRLRPLERAAAFSGLDPKWLIVHPAQAGVSRRHAAKDASVRPSANAWTLYVDDDTDGLQALRSGANLIARIDLLSTEARPFSHFVNCTENWRAPNHRELLPVRLIQPDEPLHAELTLYNGSSVPLMKARYPDGRNAALVITDHADQTAAVTLRALIGGTSDVTSPRWGQGGLLGHGLNITKALWMSSGEPAPPPLLNNVPVSPLHHPGHLGHSAKTIQTFRSRYARPSVDSTGGGRPQLDDPEVVEMAERMARIGWEIVPHSATPVRDDRDRTEAALEWFQRYKTRTWIDHQPYTNCEALVNQGFLPGQYGIVDLLHKFGYSYAWSGIDVPAGSLNLLAPRRLDHYAPVLWSAGRLSPGTPAGLWLFSTMMTYIDSSRFYALYNKKALDQLERERGLHIAHTYLEVFHPPASPLVKRNLMVPGKRPGEVVPSPKLDAMFSALSMRVARGSLWVPTLSQLGDHMRAMSAVSVRLLGDGTAVLRSPQALPGATFVLPRPGLQVLIDGQPPKGQHGNRKETTFWLDLPADRPVHVMLLDAHGEMVQFRRLPDGKSLLALARHSR